MFESVQSLSSRLNGAGSFIDPVMTQVVFLAAKLRSHYCSKVQRAVAKRSLPYLSLQQVTRTSKDCSAIEA